MDAYLIRAFLELNAVATLMAHGHVELALMGTLVTELFVKILMRYDIPKIVVNAADRFIAGVLIRISFFL